MSRGDFSQDSRCIQHPLVSRQGILGMDVKELTESIGYLENQNQENRLELSMASQGVPDRATVRLDARVSVLLPQGPEPQPRAPPPQPERRLSAPAP